MATKTKFEELTQAILSIGAQRANFSIKSSEAVELTEQHVPSLAKRMEELFNQETKELKQQLTEANALIEKLENALESYEVNEYNPGEVNWLLPLIREYKTKQTTQEVKP